MDQIRRFLTLVIDEPLYFKELTASVRPLQRIQIISAQSPRHVNKMFFPANMLFSFPACRQGIATLLDQWISRRETLETVYELFFLTFFNPDMNPRSYFITLVQALETLHRTVFKGEYLSEEAYKPFGDKMLRSISPDLEESHRHALKNRIKFGFGYSLRKRITAMIRSLEKITQDTITRNQNVFVTKIVETRNYLTHNDETTKNDVIEMNLLPIASEKIRIFLRILLLQQIGMGESDIRSAITNNHRMNSVLADDVI